jgi:type I restriction enzyme S subunit
MNSIKLLGELLGNVAVEWCALEEIGSFTRGKRFVKTDIVSDGVPCIHYGELYTHFGISAKKTKSFLNAEVASKLRFAKSGDVIIVSAGETVEDIGNGVAWVGDDDVVIHDACFAYKSNLNPAYVSYFLRTRAFKEQIKKDISSGKISSINSNALGKAKIPVPCPERPKISHEIQAEIVRILDALTELTAELTAGLTAEMAARKQQYKHYRDELLSFLGCEAEWKPLREIGEFMRGKRFTKADYVEDGIPVIHYGEIYTRYGTFADKAFSQVRADLANSLRYAKPGDIVIAGVGETVEDVGKAVAWIGNEQVAIHDDSFAFRHSMNPKYIAYVMQTSAFIAEKAKHVSSGKVNRLLINGMEKVKIPVPFPDDLERSSAEQARIVTILDKSDALTNALTEGLPREIELRHKQYEYYRDLLLSFPKPEEVEA